MQIVLNLQGHRLLAGIRKTLSSGSKEVDEIKLEVDETWKGFGKIAVFCVGKKCQYTVVDEVTQTAKIPAEVLRNEAVITIGIVGFKDEAVMTSTLVAYQVEKGSVVTIEEPKPSIYAEILSRYADLATRLNNIIANAGDLTNNAELIDARVGADDVVYDTLGEAVRGQVGSLSEENRNTSVISPEIEYETNKGYYVYSTNGRISRDENEKFSMSNFIELNPLSSKIIVRNAWKNKYVAGICFFDEPYLDNSNIVGYINYEGDDGLISGIFDIPKYAKYVTFSNNTNTGGVIKSEATYLLLVTPEGIVAEIEDSCSIAYKDDISNKYEPVEVNKAVVYNGTVRDANTMEYFLVDVSEGDRFYAEYAQLNGGFYVASGYTDGSTISENYNAGEWNAGSAEILVPKNVSKLAFNKKTADSSFKLYKIITASIGDYIDIIEKKIPSRISELDNDVGFVTEEELHYLPKGSNAPSVCIGSKLYAIVGDTLQVFYNSIIEGYSEEYVIRVQCNKGKCFPRFWEFTPTISDIGETSFIVSIYYLDGTLIEEKEVRLIIKEASNPIESKNILCVGDSTMQSGQIPIEASRRFKGTPGIASTPEPLELLNLNFVGRLKNTDKTVGWEGTGGWTFSTYLSKNGNSGFRFDVSDANNLNIGDVYQVDYSGGYYRFWLGEINVTEGTGNIFGGFYTTPDSDGQADSRIPQNGVMNRVSGNGQESITYTARTKESYMPFWNYGTDQWDIQQYVEKYCDGKVDYIIILLGINDLIGRDAFSTNFLGIIDRAKTLLRNIHSQLPNTKVLLSTLAPVSLFGGIGSNYGSSGLSGQYSANGFNRKVYEFNKELFKMEEDIEFNEYVTVVNAHAQFDAYTGYPWTEKHIVTRYDENASKEYVQTNAVHPSNSGYWMISDGLCFRSLLCLID